MFKVTREQMLSIKANKRAEYIEKLIPKFKELKPEFLPEKDEDIKKLFDAKILESAKWKMNTDELIEKYLYLCLSYEKLLGPEIPKKYVTLLTWPARSGEDKLKYLHTTLIQDQYVVKSN